MNPISSSIVISRRILQTTDIDAFNGIPETSLSPATAAAPVRRHFDPSTHFDSSMALTIVVLLTALFFLGFFSVYIRRYGAVSEAVSPPNSRHPPSKGGGLDTAAVNSLPLIPYGRTAKQLMIDDCPICLSEFNERECVKLIPYCGHVFHPRCLDTWLDSHVSCPLCRSAQLFKRADEVCLDVAPDNCAPGIRETSTVGSADTWRHEGSSGVRRTCSCSNLAHPAVLHRSASF